MSGSALAKRSLAGRNCAHTRSPTPGAAWRHNAQTPAPEQARTGNISCAAILRRTGTTADDLSNGSTRYLAAAVSATSLMITTALSGWSTPHRGTPRTQTASTSRDWRRHRSRTDRQRRRPHSDGRRLRRSNKPWGPSDRRCQTRSCRETQLVGRHCGELEQAGWHGVWVSAFGNMLRRDWFPAAAFGTILPVDPLAPVATYDVFGQRAVEGSDIGRTTIRAPRGNEAEGASGPVPMI